MPRAAPWQLPVLQPACMKTGITSSRKLSGGSTVGLRDLDRHRRPSGRRRRRSASSRRRRRGRRSPRRAGPARGWPGSIVGLGGHVAGDAVGVGRLDDDRLAVAGGRQVDLGGEDLELVRRPRRPARAGGGAARPRGRRHAGEAAAARRPGEQRPVTVVAGRCSSRSSVMAIGSLDSSDRLGRVESGAVASWPSLRRRPWPACLLSSRSFSSRVSGLAGAAAGLAAGGGRRAARRRARPAWAAAARRSAAGPVPRLCTIGSPFCVTTTWQNRFWWLPAGEALSVLMWKTRSVVSLVIFFDVGRHLVGQADQRRPAPRRGSRRPWSTLTTRSVSLPCSTLAAWKVERRRTARRSSGWPAATRP